MKKHTHIFLDLYKREKKLNKIMSITKFNYFIL